MTCVFNSYHFFYLIWFQLDFCFADLLIFAPLKIYTYIITIRNDIMYVIFLVNKCVYTYVYFGGTRSGHFYRRVFPKIN